MSPAWGARIALLLVAAIGIVAVLTSDGNARGAAALAARCAMQGADVDAQRWLERCASTLRRRGCSIDATRIDAATDHAFERALEFDVRDDAARAWWRARRDQSRAGGFFENPLRPGR